MGGERLAGPAGALGFFLFLLALASATKLAAAQDYQELEPFSASGESRVFRLPFCANNAITVELPIGYAVRHKPAIDYDVFAIAKSRSPVSDGQLIVYVGHAPQVRHPEGSSLQKGSVAGQLMNWYSWSEQIGGGTVYFSEALVDLFPHAATKRPVPILGKPPALPSPLAEPPSRPRCEEGVSLHLIVRAGSREAAATMARVAATVKKP